MNRFHKRLGALAIPVFLLLLGSAPRSAADRPARRLPSLSPSFASLDKDRLPAAWSIVPKTEDAKLAKVTVEPGRPPANNAILMDIPKEATLLVETKAPVKLAPGKEYLLVVEMKIEDMHTIGHWFQRPTGIRIRATGVGGGGKYLSVRGNGDTDDWVTAMLPLPAPAPGANCGISLQCHNMTGKIRFRNPMIIPVPPGVEAESCFILQDGYLSFGGTLAIYTKFDE